MLEFVNFYLIPGLVLGSIYALGAIGVSLLFGILRFAHFAHGDLMTLGAYLALSIVVGFGWPAIAALPLAVLGTAAVAVGIDRVFYRPFRAGPTIIVVIASFGVTLMVRSVVQLVWGVEITSYQTGIQRPLIFFDALRIAERHFYIVGGAVLLVATLHLFLTRSRMGKAMRAMSDDPDLARVTGIDTARVIAWTWVIGAGLAAAGGVFLGIDTQLNPNMGWNLLLPIFAAAILGGIGRPYGAIAGGMVIGMAEELSVYPWITDQPLLSPGYKTAVAFGLMVAILIWRPSGLFRGRVF
ncbi:MAG: branched-chain amino acid ABC transporter permease [Alphaproteobacteria bacterium]